MGARKATIAAADATASAAVATAAAMAGSTRSARSAATMMTVSQGVKTFEHKFFLMWSISMTELYNNNLKVFPTSLFLNEIRRRILVTENPQGLVES